MSSESLVNTRSTGARRRVPESSPGADELKRLFRSMLLTRRLDEKMLILLRQGKSFFHIGASGHEAVQVAAAHCLRPGTDWAYPYYRGLAFALALGMTAKEALLCFLSKADDPNSAGRQMPAHYGHRALRIVSQSSPTGTQFLQAVGTGLSLRRQSREEIVYVSCGDGTTSQGDFHEALNWASRERLPVVFVVENNRYAISVPIEQQTAGGSISRMVSGYEGLHAAHVDGCDFFASLRVMEQAVSRAREGHGPSLIEADVVRLLPHSSSDNQAKYRSPEELAADRERDPIPALEAELIRRGVLDPAEVEPLRESVRDEVDRMAEDAEAAAYPERSTATHHVYSDLAYRAPEGASAEPAKTIRDSIVLVDAVNHALAEEMERDERIYVYGQDVEDDKGGVFTATRGLSRRFGKDRVFNSPLAESSIIGTAIGMAVTGVRPVVEIQFGDYIWTAMMQLRNEVAMMRYRSAGRWTCPMVIRVPVGGYIHGAPYHSQNIEATFAHFPGLYVGYPSNAADAKGLLKSAIRGDDPYLFLEHKGSYRQAHAARPEPDEDFLLPWGLARVARRGEDLTVVTYGAMVKKCLDGAQRLERDDNLSVEVIDIRTMVPLDLETILASVRKTGRVLIVHEDVLFSGFGAELAAQIGEQGFEHLDAPVRRLAGANTPIPYNWHLEAEILPQDDGIREAMKDLAAF